MKFIALLIFVAVIIGITMLFFDVNPQRLSRDNATVTVQKALPTTTSSSTPEPAPQEQMPPPLPQPTTAVTVKDHAEQPSAVLTSTSSTSSTIPATDQPSTAPAPVSSTTAVPEGDKYVFKRYDYMNAAESFVAYLTNKGISFPVFAAKGAISAEVYFYFTTPADKERKLLELEKLTGMSLLQK